MKPLYKLMSAMLIASLCLAVGTAEAKQQQADPAKGAPSQTARLEAGKAPVKGAKTEKIKVACIGDSITFGFGIKDRENDSYPAQLGQILGSAWEVMNFGRSGLTLMGKGDHPYIKAGAYRKALAYQPDVVVIKLGTNDCKLVNWKHKADYEQDYLKMIASFRSLPSKPEMFICKPVPVYPERWGITDQVVREEIVPLVEQVGKKAKVEVIDLYTALSNRADLFPDKVHPNVAGAGLIAKTVAAHIAKDSSVSAQAPKQNLGKKNPNKKANVYHPSVPKRTLSNVPYGTHRKQVLDFWKAPSASADKPAPLVVFIHGGAWMHGSKEKNINGCIDVNALLKAGVSVAAIEYRFVSEANAAGIVPPVKAPLGDAARALQFVRSKANAWHIDKKRIAATGGSAGGCSSLWLAYHDDMADPDSEDPLARESTRLFCAAVRIPQSTLDPQQIQDWLTAIPYGGHAFGVKNQDFLNERERLLPWIKEYSPYALVTPDDPPVVTYYASRFKDDLKAHSPRFGIHLAKRCKEIGVFCEVRGQENTPAENVIELTDYLIEKLTAPTATKMAPARAKKQNKKNQNKQAPAYHPSVPKPSMSNVPYGTHQRHVLDFWKAALASAENPAPLVFYIHGGSWLHESKENIKGCVDVNALLKAGISVVAINYRYVSQAEAEGVLPPVKAPLEDAARALQFVRSKAKEWHIDKTRIGAAGASAGGCSSLWLAYHDDLADPDSDDSVARESTRLFCAGVRVPQTSLDPQQMKEWLTKITYGGHAFGVKNQDFLSARESLLPWIQKYSPYAHVSADDPPVSMYYNKYLEKDLNAHSPQFGFHLQKRCKELGLYCEVLYDRAPGCKQNDVTAYLIKTLAALVAATSANGPEA
jgi:acetyl esterase/lipase